MSTALPEPLHSIPVDTPETQPPRHLKSVSQDPLMISQVPSPSGTHAVAQAPQVLLDPAEQYTPERLPQRSFAESNVYYLDQRSNRQLVDQRQREQCEAIKHMTRTIGAAFVEAELGVRPFIQLGTWIELELFQKLRARVERTIQGNYLTAWCNAPGDTTVPSVTPIGVRATMQDNGDWESSMTIRVGQRARAIAMRLRLHRERWKVTALEIG